MEMSARSFNRVQLRESISHTCRVMFKDIKIVCLYLPWGGLVRPPGLWFLAWWMENVLKFDYTTGPPRDLTCQVKRSKKVEFRCFESGGFIYLKVTEVLMRVRTFVSTWH